LNSAQVGFWLHTGGTDINSALAYCEKQIEIPAKTHLVLITDLYEGGDANSMLARTAAIKHAGHPAYEAKHAEAIASLGCPVLACTPDQFPSMMAAALTGKDLSSWAAETDIALIRGS
jgi:VWA domain containing CoxE-like protein